MFELKRHIHANTVDRVVVKKLVNKLFLRCQCKHFHKFLQKRQSKSAIAEDFNDELYDLSDDFLSQACEEQMNNGEIEHANGPIEGTINNERKNSEGIINNEEKHMEVLVNDEVKHIEGMINDKETQIEGVINDEVKHIEGMINDEGKDVEGLFNGEKNGQIQDTTLSNSEQIKRKNDTVNEQVKDVYDVGNMENGGTITSKSNEHIEDMIHVENRQESSKGHRKPSRICGGHDVALSIESAVQELDMTEESIATLLCYLELHPNSWLEVLKPVKALCTVKFYGGHTHLKAVAKRIPPIAAAVVHCEKKGKKRFKKQNNLLFPVVEIADKMGWDLDPVFKELRALQWNSSLAPDSKMSSSGQSGILVEFSDNAMHVRTPGDLSDEERDDMCDFINDRIQAEERTQLKQLNKLYTSLKNISCSEYWQCSDEVDKESDLELKLLIKSYFDDKNNATQNELEAMKKERENPNAAIPDNPRDERVNWDGISRDIRALTNIHHDQSFTGRAVARIFHGISSPCYPAEVWGRDRRFWRKFLDVDFNSLRIFATRELLKLR